MMAFNNTEIQIKLSEIQKKLSPRPIIKNIISRQKTLDVFKYEQELIREYMDELDRTKDIDFYSVYFVWQTKMVDLLFLNFGVEKEDYQIAFTHHKLGED